MKELKNKVAVVTGAGSGIGRALCCALADQGCNIAACDINADTAQATAELARERGVRTSSHQIDVAQRKQMEALPEAVRSKHDKVNIVVNNAGTGVGAKFEDHSLDDFEWLVGINLMGVIYGSKVFLDELKDAGEGQIVNISSLAGIIPAAGMSSYCTTKFAVRGFSESIRQELAPYNIGVTSVHPGFIATSIARDARITSAELKEKHDDSVRVFERYGRPPEKAAREIVRGIRRNEQRVLIGVEAHLGDLFKRLAPVGSDRANNWLAEKIGIS